MSMARAIGVAVPRGLSAGWGVVMSMRPWQWSKNLLVFLPFMFSLGERWSLESPGVFVSLLGQTVLAFLVLCALSSGVYLINDILDREQDRLHPVKRRRPIASGVVPVTVAKVVSGGLLATALLGGLALGAGVALIALVYLATNVAYSYYLKHMAILDVMALSAGFILRVVAGSLVIGVVTSPWLYTTVGLGALFLSLGKRQAELMNAGEAAKDQRSVLGQYTPQLLSQLITITATSTLLAYGLYTFSASNVPDNNSMMLTVPFVVFGLFRYIYILNKSRDGEAPDVVMVKDIPLIAGIALWGLTAVAVLAFNR